MQRLTSHRDFVQVLKRRRKVTDKNIVVHYLVRDDAFVGAANSGVGIADGADTGNAGNADTRRLGLAVSKAVGNAVVRNGVKRRFRVLARSYEQLLPEHCDIVMRAKPSAAHVPFASLDEQVSRLFGDIASKCEREAAKVAERQAAELEREQNHGRDADSVQDRVRPRTPAQNDEFDESQSGLDHFSDSVEFGDAVGDDSAVNTDANAADYAAAYADTATDPSDAPTAEIPVVAMTSLHQQHRDGFTMFSGASA